MPILSTKTKYSTIVKGLAGLLLTVPMFLMPRTANKLSADSNYQYYPATTNTQPYYYYPNTTTNNNPYYYNSPVQSSGNFSLTSNNNFCVGQTPVYTITDQSAAGQTINWTSTHNGSISSQTTFMLDGSGNWSASGNAWLTGDVGQWTKTASINGQTQSLNFTVQNCGNTSNSGNPYYPGNPYPTSGGSGSFSLTSNNNFCVGQTPVYTITGQPSMAGQTINWTGINNGATVNQASFILDGSGNWTASGNTWISTDVGSWQKIASINGVSQTLTFSVQNCGNANNNSGYGTVYGQPSNYGTIGGSANNYGTIGGSTAGFQTIGGSTYGNNQTIGGSTYGNNQTIGGSAYGNNQTIGGSTAGFQTIGGSAGGNDAIIGNSAQ